MAEAERSLRDLVRRLHDEVVEPASENRLDVLEFLDSIRQEFASGTSNHTRWSMTAADWDERFDSVFLLAAYLDEGARFAAGRLPRAELLNVTRTFGLHSAGVFETIRQVSAAFVASSLVPYTLVSSALGVQVNPPAPSPQRRPQDKLRTVVKTTRDDAKVKLVLGGHPSKSVKGRMLHLAAELLMRHLPVEPTFEQVRPWLDVLVLGDITLADGSRYGEDHVYLGLDFFVPLFAALFPHLSSDEQWWDLKLYQGGPECEDAARGLAQWLVANDARFRAVSVSFQ